MIVEFDSFLAFIPFAVAPPFGFDASAHDGSLKAFVGGTEDLRNGRAIPSGDGISQEGCEALSGQFLGLGLREFSEVDEGRVDVYEFDNAWRGQAVAFGSRRADDERGSGSLFEESTFLPDAIMLAKVVSVVTPENNDSGAGESIFFKSIEHASDLSVDE